jgi:hypothetical protein
VARERAWIGGDVVTEAEQTLESAGYFLPFFVLVAFCSARWTLAVCVAAGEGKDLRIVRSHDFINPLVGTTV